MRLKHNKKRNTAFVYEALVRELTKAIIKNDKSKRGKIVGIIKEHFHKGTALLEELSIYKSLYESSSLKVEFAEKLMVEAKIAYSKLDKSRIFKEQSSLIKKINKSLNNSVFNNFVPNYKNLASIYSIFNDTINVKEKVLLEEKTLEFLVGDRKENNDKKKDPIDNLVYRSFVKRFNEKYQGSLNENQKNMLTKYVTSFVDDGLELKMYLNEEIGDLKQKLKNAMTEQVLRDDKDLLEKTKKVLDILEGYRNSDIGLDTIEEVLRIQELACEIEKDGN